jgi:hypothetical protein
MYLGCPAGALSHFMMRWQEVSAAEAFEPLLLVTNPARLSWQKGMPVKPEK